MREPLPAVASLCSFAGEEAEPEADSLDFDELYIDAVTAFAGELMEFRDNNAKPGAVCVQLLRRCIQASADVFSHAERSVCLDDVRLRRQETQGQVPPRGSWI